VATTKEKCFRKAIDKINDGRGAKGQKKLDVKHEQGWVRDKNNGWQQETWTGGLWRRIQYTWDAAKGLVNPRAAGRPNPEQFRKPDLTLPQPNGKNPVLDIKFTDSKGNVDPWRETTGMGGKKQREDYKDINKEQGVDMDEPSLDKNSCDCGKRKLETETVRVPVPALQPGSQFYVVPENVPGALPGRVPAPRLPPVRVPFRIPIPVW
jgi:hypothetical protein